MIGSYSSIFALGHKALATLFDGSVRIDEKVDGSQFSFGFKNYISDGIKPLIPIVEFKSKGAVIHEGNPPKMFARGVEYVMSIRFKLHSGWTYRCEYLDKPKHNALAYNRVPTNGLMLFDVGFGGETYADYPTLCEIAGELNIEPVPALYEGKVHDIESLKALLNTKSVLGGQLIEGIVVKNYEQFGINKKVLMGKFVSEAFKETHRQNWKTPKQAGDIVDELGRMYNSTARWDKAIIHLREEGKLSDSAQDIGPILKEIWPDIVKECEDEIKQRLWDWAEDKIRKKVTAGFPEYYKKKLLDNQPIPGLDLKGVESHHDLVTEVPILTPFIIEETP